MGNRIARRGSQDGTSTMPPRREGATLSGWAALVAASSPASAHRRRMSSGKSGAQEVRPRPLQLLRHSRRFHPFRRRGEDPFGVPTPPPPVDRVRPERPELQHQWHFPGHSSGAVRRLPPPARSSTPGGRTTGRGLRHPGHPKPSPGRRSHRPCSRWIRERKLCIRRCGSKEPPIVVGVILIRGRPSSNM